MTSAARTALAALVLASCQSRSYAIVTVQAASGLPAIVQLRVHADDGLSQGVAVIPGAPVNAGIVFPQSYTNGFSSSASSLAVLVEGLGADGGLVVARGSASTGLQSSVQAALTVSLTTACASARDCDPNGVCAGTVLCGPQGACIAGGGTPPAPGSPCGPFQGVCAVGSCFLPYCGSGVVAAGEQCDWGSGLDGGLCTGPDGGCNSDIVPNACRSDCMAAHCGDKVVDQGERCDLGQALNGTGQAILGESCNATCTLFGAVSTYAGQAGGPGDFDGVGIDARFDSPGAVAVDADYVYVIDPGEPLLRRVSRVGGAVSTWVGRRGVEGYAEGVGSAATLGRPGGLALAGGFLYLSDAAYAIIRRVDPATGTVTTVAGIPGALGSQDGPALQATFDDDWGLATCDGQELYIADVHNCVLRRLDLDAGMVTTVAGGVGSCSEGDGQGSAARFFFPTWVACDGATLYVGDDTGTVRFVDIDAGYQVTSPKNPITPFGQYPPPVAVAGGILYVIDANTGVILAGATATAEDDGGLSPFVGGGDAGVTIGYADGTGTAALFNVPEELAADPTGSVLYVPDTGNSAIRAVGLPGAVVSTLAGEGPHAGSENGVGSAALFKSPWGITWVGGALYVADRGNDLLRAVELAAGDGGGAVTTLAGQTGLPETQDGTGAQAAFTVPTAVAAFEGGLVVGESATLRQVALPEGSVTTLTGEAPFPLGLEDGSLATAQFSSPSGLAAGADGGQTLYVADQGNDVVRAVDLAGAGQVSTLAGHAGLSGTGDAEGARFNSPNAVVFLGGQLFVADTGNEIIRQVDPDGGAVTTVAGFPGVVAYTDGVGQAAAFDAPQGLCTDGTSLYIVDTGNNAIRQLDPATGTVTTVAGGGAAASVDGVGTAAYFNTPTGCSWDPGSGDLFVTDRQENVLRRIH